MSESNPGPNITTGANSLGGGSPVVLGQSATALVGFYGAAPLVQRASSLQATSVISGISTGAVSTNSLVLNTLVEIMNTLNGLGVWKGAA